VRAAVGRQTPHPGPSLRALLGEQQRRALVEHEPRLAAARLGRLLLVGEQAAALHEVDGEGDRFELEQEVLAAPTDRDELGARTPSSGAGTAVLSAVNVIGRKAVSVRPRNCSVSRSAWAWTSGSSGTSPAHS
jgi:hypothetical protein